METVEVMEVGQVAKLRDSKVRGKEDGTLNFGEHLHLRSMLNIIEASKENQEESIRDKGAQIAGIEI